jgi:hypothetical protein
MQKTNILKESPKGEGFKPIARKIKVSGTILFGTGFAVEGIRRGKVILVWQQSTKRELVMRA